MLQALVITLREGFEAFLIVAISLAYLRKSGRARADPRRPLGHRRGGCASARSAATCCSTRPIRSGSTGRSRSSPPPRSTWMIVHMWRAGRRMKGDIEGRLQSSSVKPGTAAFTGVFLFTLLMVSREGMETALLLMQLRETRYLVLGAAARLVGAAGVAWLWSRFGHRINLALFFQVTAIFLFVFVVQLVIRGHARNGGAALSAVQRDHSRAHRIVGTRQHVRSPADVSARDPSARLAAAEGGVLEAAGLPAGRAVASAPASPSLPDTAEPTGSSHSALLTAQAVPKPPTVLDLTWIGDLKFSGTSDRASITLDSAGVAGPSPVQALAFALAGCMAMDLAHILSKGRCPYRALRAHLEAKRADEDPHRIVAWRCISPSKAT